MKIARVVCSQCGKPLDSIPAFLGEGEGAKLFQCEECFYPGCQQTRSIRGRSVGLRNRLNSIVADLDRELSVVDS